MSSNQNQTDTPESQTTPILDLSVGNPSFMVPYWNLIANYYSGSLGMTRIQPDAGMEYNYSQTNDKLVAEIVSLHNKIGNVETRGREIVLGHGAGQLVAAAAFATSGTVKISYPLWPRLPLLIVMAQGLRAFKYPYVSQDSPAELIVYPNNPDHALPSETGHGTRIHDLCYNWPQYFSDGKVSKITTDIAIFGLSKATGHAGTRLGWALVKNPATAKLMRTYIELSTSGVSSDAQARGEIILNTIKRCRDAEMPSCFDVAQDLLSTRWGTFRRAAAKCNDFTIGGGGMFAWCSRRDGVTTQNIEDKLGIKVFDGEPFGDETCFRLSMGSTDSDFAELIKRMKVVYGS